MIDTLTDAVGCVWENPPEGFRAGSRLLPAEFHLKQGVARIRCDGGTDLTLEGPAALRLDSGTAATILHGKVVFRADGNQIGGDRTGPGGLYSLDWKTAKLKKGKHKLLVTLVDRSGRGASAGRTVRLCGK